MKVTGIAGGIGSGKSVVSRILRLRGRAVYDCDYEARRLMESREGSVRQLLEAKFGEEIFLPSGGLDRKRLAAVMFGDPEILAWVNHTVHAAVKSDIEEWLSRCEKSGEQGVWIESAILAGSGLVRMCDEVWLVSAPEEVRIDRAVGRGLPAQDVVRRIVSQKAEEELLRKSGVRIAEIANGPDDTLLDRIEQLL